MIEGPWHLPKLNCHNNMHFKDIIAGQKKCLTTAQMVPVVTSRLTEFDTKSALDLV